MSLFRFLFAPSLLVVAVIAGAGRSPVTRAAVAPDPAPAPPAAAAHLSGAPSPGGLLRAGRPHPVGAR